MQEVADSQIDSQWFLANFYLGSSWLKAESSLHDRI
jgi:hypothetical protein